MQPETGIKKRFLLICNDVMGKRMAGPAIRYYEMAKALSHYHDVTLIAPGSDEADFPELILRPDAPGVVEAESKLADFVIFQGDAMEKNPCLKSIKGVLIADLYCPIALEYHQSSVGVVPDVRMQTAVYLARLVSDQLHYADHFICASEKQQDFWLGALAVAGRINGLRWPNASHANIEELVSLVPFGLPDQQPEKDGPGLRARFNIPLEDFVAVWGGGIYQWLDPLTPIRAIHRLIAEGHKVHLVFMGVKHPNPNIHEHDMCTQAVELAKDLGLVNRFVHFNYGWVGYEQRQNFFLEADVGVCAHFDNPETRFAFRTRMLDYLWCGLPIVTTRGDFFSDNVTKHQLGLAVDFESVGDWYVALKKMNDYLDLRISCKQRIATFSHTLTWTTIMHQFMKNIQRGGIAADREVIRRDSSKSSIQLGLVFKLRRAYAVGGWRKIRDLVIQKLISLVKLK